MPDPLAWATSRGHLDAAEGSAAERSFLALHDSETAQSPRSARAVHDIEAVQAQRSLLLPASVSGSSRRAKWSVPAPLIVAVVSSAAIAFLATTLSSYVFFEDVPAPGSVKIGWVSYDIDFDFTQHGCATPDSGLCLESGDDDDDCCAIAGSGSCKAGSVYIAGPVCFKENGALATCCKSSKAQPPLVTNKSQCAPSEDGRCLEDREVDADCCALPGQGTCTAGYTYYQGALCTDYGTFTTCCEIEATTTTDTTTGATTTASATNTIAEARNRTSTDDTSLLTNTTSTKAHNNLRSSMESMPTTTSNTSKNHSSRSSGSSSPSSSPSSNSKNSNSSVSIGTSNRTRKRTSNRTSNRTNSSSNSNSKSSNSSVSNGTSNRTRTRTSNRTSNRTNGTSQATISRRSNSSIMKHTTISSSMADGSARSTVKHIWTNASTKTVSSTVATISTTVTHTVTSSATSSTTTSTGTQTSSLTTVTTTTVSSTETTHLCEGAEKNCMARRCCREEGMQCYRKTETFASCRSSCRPGFIDFKDSTQTPWTCERLGSRTPSSPGTGTGSWPGQNCAASRRCNLPGYMCFAKNEEFASCRKSCQQTQEDRCVRLGGHMPIPAAQPLVEAPPETSLFCFVGSAAPEWFMQDQQNNKRGIFDCDGWQDFPGGLPDDLWHVIHSTGKYADYHWTVRVDPDMVFFPGRLREHLGTLLAPQQVPVYLSDAGVLHQQFQVLSAPALEAYISGYDKCAQHLAEKRDGHIFFQACLDALGIEHMEDQDMLRTDVAGHCLDWRYIVFPPQPKLQNWNTCWGEAQGTAEGRSGEEARAVLAEMRSLVPP